MTSTPTRPLPAWAATAGHLAVAAALPSAVWRVLVGLGLGLGTPNDWRAEQDIPGSGTAYVVFLSVLQIGAAGLTLVLVRPSADVGPRWAPVGGGRRYPAVLVVAASLLGAVIVASICGLAVANWSAVDPFAGAGPTGWRWVCWACYAVAFGWSAGLLVATAGYALSRRPGAAPADRVRPGSTRWWSGP